MHWFLHVCNDVRTLPSVVDTHTSATPCSDRGPWCWGRESGQFQNYGNIYHGCTSVSPETGDVIIQTVTLNYSNLG
eukprot:3325281-Rhodomonas_salina.1